MVKRQVSKIMVRNNEDFTYPCGSEDGKWRIAERNVRGRMYEYGDLIEGRGKWQMEPRMTPGFWFECLNDGPCTKKGNRKDSRPGLMEIMTSQGEFSKLM